MNKLIDNLKNLRLSYLNKVVFLIGGWPRLNYPK
jgi:hypothetical protein